VIGLRPGEKLREELTSQGIEIKKTSHPRIWSSRQNDVPRQTIVHAVREIRRACAAGDAAMALSAIAAAVPEYEPSDAAVKHARLVSQHVGVRAGRESAYRTETLGRTA
jgi:FlaA1/EpsC-like NDP-sugar epimerase